MIILKYSNSVDIFFEDILEPFAFWHSYNSDYAYKTIEEYLIEKGLMEEKDKISFEEYQKRFREHYF